VAGAQLHKKIAVEKPADQTKMAPDKTWRKNAVVKEAKRRDRKTKTTQNLRAQRNRGTGQKNRKQESRDGVCD